MKTVELFHEAQFIADTSDTQAHAVLAAGQYIGDALLCLAQAVKALSRQLEAQHVDNTVRR